MPILIPFQHCSKPSLLLEREVRFCILIREFAGSSSSHLSSRCFWSLNERFPKCIRLLLLLSSSSGFRTCHRCSLAFAILLFLRLAFSLYTYVTLVCNTCLLFSPLALFLVELHYNCILWGFSILRFLLLPHLSYSLRYASVNPKPPKSRHLYLSGVWWGVGSKRKRHHMSERDWTACSNTLIT